MSVSTLVTVSDVMSLMDTSLSTTASLSESRKFILGQTKRDKVLGNQAIDEIENLKNILIPIAHNASSLVNLMAKTGAILSGPQATSFFYPICNEVEAPWDIFCHSSTAEDLIRGYMQSCSPELVEDSRTDNNMRVVHMRKSVPGYGSPANIRVYVSNSDPMASILSLKNTYEQTAVSAVGAVCFWPKLMSRGAYRTLDSNVGKSLYPKGRTFYEVRLSKMKKIRLRKEMDSPEVIVGLGQSVESVIFKNTSNIPDEDYSTLTEAFKNVVYAVFNSSTKYIGSTSGMN